MPDLDLPLLPAEPFPPDLRELTRQQVLELVKTTHRSQPWYRRRRLLIGGAVVALAFAGGGTAAAFQIFGPKQVTNHDSARCYSQLSTDFGDDFPGTTVSAPLTPHSSASPEPDRAHRQAPVAPIEECAQAWEVGLLSGHAPDPIQRTYPVPHLVGCVLPDGTAAVFPGPDGACQSLGLASASPK